MTKFFLVHHRTFQKCGIDWVYYVSDQKVSVDSRYFDVTEIPNPKHVKANQVNELLVGFLRNRMRKIELETLLGEGRLLEVPLEGPLVQTCADNLIFLPESHEEAKVLCESFRTREEAVSEVVILNVPLNIPYEQKDILAACRAPPNQDSCVVL